MIIIGCDYHPSFQQIAWVDTETGEVEERKLMHGNGEAEQFYRQLSGPVRVGLEATGNCHWFLDMLAEMGHEVWVGDAARISAKQVRQQRTDRRGAAHTPALLAKEYFPRVWTPTPADRGQCPVLIYPHKPWTPWMCPEKAREERAETRGAEPGDAEGEITVEPGRTEAVARTAAGLLGQDQAPGLAGAAQEAGRADHSSGPGGEESSRGKRKSSPADDP